jgi:hypothetical protein
VTISAVSSRQTLGATPVARGHPGTKLSLVTAARSLRHSPPRARQQNGLAGQLTSVERTRKPALHRMTATGPLPSRIT